MLNPDTYTSKTEAHFMRLICGMAILFGIGFSIFILMLLIQAPLAAFVIIGFPAICYGLGYIVAYLIRRKNAKNGE